MAISRRRARNGGSDGLVFPAAFVALVLLIYFIALPPALPPGMATPLTGGLQIYTLAPSASTTSAVPGNASLDVLFHRLSDKFGLVDSGLSDAEILHLIRQIRGIWQAAGVDIRIDEKQALVVRRASHPTSAALSCRWHLRPRRGCCKGIRAMSRRRWRLCTHWRATPGSWPS